MTLSAGRSNFRLAVLPETDFPDLTAGQFSHAFKIAPNAMKSLIDRTQFAISTEETRYYLNGHLPARGGRRRRRHAARRRDRRPPPRPGAGGGA